MKRMTDLTGKKFGRLTVLEYAGRAERNSYQRPQWRCKCDCGEQVIVLGQNLREGKTKSCGCLRAEKLRERARKR